MPREIAVVMVLPLEVLLDPLLSDVVGQVAHPQVPRLAHHRGGRPRPAAA